MKQERDQRDVARVVSLTDDFLENVKHQEDWFHTFSDHYKKVDIACQKCKLDKEIADLVGQGAGEDGIAAGLWFQGEREGSRRG